MNHDEDTFPNLIFYGPPGTGKTYAVQLLLAEHYTETIEDVSLSEWQSLAIDEHIRPFKWWEAITAALYDMQSRLGQNDVKVPQLAEHPFVIAVAEAKGHSGTILSNVRQSLNAHTAHDSKTVRHQQVRHYPQLFDKTKEANWYLMKEWEQSCSYIKETVAYIQRGPQKKESSIKRYEWVTFHQSYGYEEFVEGLRPVVNKKGQMRYDIQPGIFLRLCERARQDPTHRYAMVIDEINRGNISKIFGELITLIEPDKREGQQSIHVVLPYSGQRFCVPSNVTIIGTMNTADRSLAAMDIALRRRFEFVEKKPDVELLACCIITHQQCSIDIQQLFKILNQRIEILYDREHTIGHAYFMDLMTLKADQQFRALKELFEHRIIPLLQEYFFEDWQKIRWILGDHQKKELRFQFIQECNIEEELMALFGSAHDINLYTLQARYQLNKESLDCPQAYSTIYAI